MSSQLERMHIAVGVILDQATGKVLVARRPDHVHLGGLLEFPGGKLSPGELVRTALDRELQEELNINVTGARPLIQIKHDYASESVLLDVWLVTGWTGKPEGMEAQEIMWLPKDALSAAEFPVANRPIITALNLPTVYGITPDTPAYGDEFFTRLETELKNGLRLIQFRSKKLDEKSRCSTLKKIFELCHDYDSRVLLNGLHNLDLIKNSHGVHLTSEDLLSLEERPLGEDYLVAASCHNSVEMDHAGRIGIDFIVLSPVNESPSHKNSVPIGWDCFSKLVLDCNVPVYALGGMKMTDVDNALSSGGQGVAMISGLWNR